MTIFDDRFDVYRDDDLARLRALSDVVALSDRRSLHDLLAAERPGGRPLHGPARERDAPIESFT